MAKNKSQNQEKYANLMKDIEKEHNMIKQDMNRQRNDKTFSNQINQWTIDSITKIELAAQQAKAEVQRLTEESSDRLTGLLKKLLNDLNKKQTAKTCTDSDIQQLNELLEKCTNELEDLKSVTVISNDLSSLDLIKVTKTSLIAKETAAASSPIANHVRKKSPENIRSTVDSPNGDVVTSRFEETNYISTALPSKSFSYPSISFGLNRSNHKSVQELFQHLKSLPAMDKNGPMNGDCDFETTQMEKFLSKTFAFKNFDGEYIVPGVKSFRLGKPVHLMDPSMVVYFPSETNSAFAMSVQEILEWQRSYIVYADKYLNGINKEFLERALQGQSGYGKEAFLMKFVVRISQCPILMDMDGQIISRQLEESWPNRIKLVSVTGIDFAGRIHDVGDTCTYVTNWKDVYEIDPQTDLPLVYNGRDFRRKDNGPLAKLNQKRLLDDLMRMARLRLRACDLEKVHIVVETGIGLGVFAGRDIGIDEIVRALSAFAIRRVLEEDGPSYQYIRAVVFALPVFEEDKRNDRRQAAYQSFINEFNRNNYQGRIPVLIADQDMHRLAVAIAREGYTVSELNPADSHGVFGEYWQNRGPAVEEKLALTTLGLLVQHHLINPQVLDPDYYNLI